MGRYSVYGVGVVGRTGRTGQRLKNYDKKNRRWGDEWEMNKLVDLGLSMNGVNTGGSMTGGLTVNLMKSMAESTFKRLIGQGLQIILMKCDVDLSIYTRDKNLMWADDTSFKKFRFTQQNVNSEFRRMIKHIDKIELCRMGPLMDMLYAIADWSSEVKPGNKALLSFSFEWS